MGRSEQPTIQALTGLRFFAALHVVLFHMTMGHISAFPNPLRNILLSAPVAVDFFFVLSGFILTYNYPNLKAADRWSFWSARVSRIIPVYVLGLFAWMPILIRETLALSGDATLSVIGQVSGAALIALLFLQSWYPPAVNFLNPPGWSVSVEAFFYVLFPFLQRQLHKFRQKRFLLVAMGMWLLSMVPPLAYVYLNPDGIGAGSPEIGAFWLNVVKYHPLGRLPEFVIGMVTGECFCAKMRMEPLSPATHSLIGLMLIIGAIVSSSIIPFPLLHNGILSPLFAYFIFNVASREGPIARYLSRPGVVLLGEASYSLYLLHAPVERWARKVASLFGFVDTFSLTYNILWGLAALLFSLIVFRMFEEPARRALKARLARLRWILDSHRGSAGHLGRD